MIDVDALLKTYDMQAIHEFLLMLGTFTLVACLFIIIDMFIGIFVSIRKKKRIMSSKLGVTTMKILAQLLYVFLASLVFVFISSSLFTKIVLIIPVVLYILKEYISIGENIAIYFNGKTPYLFQLLDKIFYILERLFFSIFKRWVEKLSIHPDEKKIDCDDDSGVIKDYTDNGEEP